ncbi:hypothetical protein UT300018_01230 [Clostridium faecium]|uniref:hypothetical protein n=1 Tax=Clostridium faecium TaxID=2762223 RepID=UPI001FACE6D3|nr:hypothetical protein [Clostridium faecium]
MKNKSTLKGFLAFFIILTISMMIWPNFAWSLLIIVPLAYLIFLFKKSSKFKSRNVIIKGIISTFLLCTVLTGIGGIAIEYETSNEPSKEVKQITSNKNSINETVLGETSKDEKEEEAKRIADEKAKREVEEKKAAELKEKQAREELARKEQAKKEAEEKARRDAEEKKQLEQSIVSNSTNEVNNNIEPEVELEPETVNDDISTVVYITETGEKYHLGGCRYLSKSKIEISLQDAVNRGYTPCSRCSPPQ